MIEHRRRAGRRVGAEMLVAAPLIGADRVLPDPRRRGSRRAQGDGREVALVHRLEYADADPVGHGSVDHAPGRDLRIRAGRCGRLRRGTCDRIEDVDVEIVDRGVRPLHLDRDDVVGMEGRIAGGNREREQVVVTGVRDRRAVGPVGPRNVVGGVGAGGGREGRAEGGRVGERKLLRPAEVASGTPSGDAAVAAPAPACAELLQGSWLWLDSFARLSNPQGTR